MDEMSAPLPGWYTDPSDPLSVRWWSGESWTDHVQPAAPPTGEPVPVALPPASADGPYTPMTATAVAPPRLRGRAARIENERQARKNNKFAYTGLLVGVVGFLFNVFGILSILAIVFSSIGLARAQGLSDAGAPFTGRGTAIAGLVLGFIGLAAFAVGVYSRSGV
jgi:hypothetical protein